MFVQRPRSYPVVLLLCSALLLLFGLSQVHISSEQKLVGSSHYHARGPILATSDEYPVQSIGGKVKVNRNQIKANQRKTEEQAIAEHPKAMVEPDFYSENYWSMSLEKRSEVNDIVYNMPII